nr:MAG TPA: tail protein [Caudoviricetes sp.]
MDELKRTIDLLIFAPPVSRDSHDMQELYKTDGAELQELWDVLCDIFCNQFIRYMTGYGLKQWEFIFDVMPKATDTMQNRRRRILQLLMGTRPYTMRSFQAILDNIYGKGNIIINVDENKYEFWMTIAADMLSNSRDILDFAEIIVPKNLYINIRNVKRIEGMLYIGGKVQHRNHMVITAYIGVSIERLTAPQTISGAVIFRNQFIIIGGK